MTSLHSAIPRSILRSPLPPRLITTATATIIRLNMVYSLIMSSKLICAPGVSPDTDFTERVTLYRLQPAMRLIAMASVYFPFSGTGANCCDSGGSPHPVTHSVIPHLLIAHTNLPLPQFQRPVIPSPGLTGLRLAASTQIPGVGYWSRQPRRVPNSQNRLADC